MPNPFGAPEVSVQEVNQKRIAAEPQLLVDVREAQEYGVRISGDDVVMLPLSELAARQLESIPETLSDKEQEVVIFCHHGMRSAQATMWFMQQGWTNVKSMDGGIDAWANEVDPSIGTY
ncbi:MAG: rhodanese-like domain-containing protein [Chloroflexota bacterium]